MPFVNIYYKESRDIDSLRDVVQKCVAKAASGKVRGVVGPEEVETVFLMANPEDHFIKPLVFQVFLRKTDERVANFEERHHTLLSDLKSGLETEDFSLQTTLTEHFYSET